MQIVDHQNTALTENERNNNKKRFLLKRKKKLKCPIQCKINNENNCAKVKNVF